MRGVIEVLRVNVERAKGRKWYVITTLSFMLLSILAAVVFSSRVDVHGTIAYVAAHTVSAGVHAEEGLGIGGRGPFLPGFRIEEVNEIPLMSQFVRNRYDAAIVDHGNGQREIITLKNEDFRLQLEQALLDPESFTPETRGVRGIGANIVGYLVMFVMLSGSMFMNFYADDKASGTFRRTVTSPVGIRTYLAGQVLFNAIMLLVPTMSFLIMLNKAFHVDIGFSYSQYMLLLGLLTMLATTFGLFMTSLIESADNALAMASTIVILTSLLSGTFYSFHHDSVVVNFITSALPQKSLMQIAHGLEQGQPFAEWGGLVSYTVVLAFVLCALGWRTCKRRFLEGRY